MQEQKNSVRFLRDIIFARLEGTGIHLIQEADGRNKNQVSYRKYRIWGIKGLTHAMGSDIYNTLVEFCPTTGEIAVDDVVRALSALCQKYLVDSDIFQTKIHAYLDDPVFWSNMDDMQRKSFLIAAFFDSLDETRIALAEQLIQSIIHFPFSKAFASTFPKLVRDLGFLFRAREYAEIFSTINSGSYSNVLNRANAVLAAEYAREMHSELDTTAQEEKSEPIVEDSQLNREIERLSSNSEEEVLDAIINLRKFGSRAVPFLETLLHHPSDEVQMKALITIMEIKNMPLNELTIQT
ncbi:MAG TPA: hypothetical protein VKK79_02710 [Candidatus Lokiarchaeia archaeon]|nr:hypothetical protein [Candidatus Lokiarchaeia archaeon]